MLFTISSLKLLYSRMMDIDHYMINQDYKFEKLSTKYLYTVLDKRTQRYQKDYEQYYNLILTAVVNEFGK